MEFSPNQYLLLYALIVTPVVVSFFFIRRNQTPTKLNLDGRKVENPPSDPKEADTAPGIVIAKNRVAPEPRKQNAPGHAAPKAQPAPRPRTKVLNVFFQWNGHAWDAYEVLGIPAGSSAEAAGQAYQAQITKGDAESMLFFKAAYEAIMRSNS